MKSILFIFTLLIIPFSYAESTNNLSAQIIPYAKDVGFGVAYERSFRPNISLAGALTYLPENNNAVAHPAAGLFSLAAQIRLHQNIEFLDFYMAPGLNIMKMEFLTQDDTSIGASFAFGTLVQLNDQFALGVEFSITTPWFNDDFYTVSRAYFVNSAITGRFTF